MKILFLDCDGVLNNYKDRNFGEQFSKPCCDALNYILAKDPEIKIVISSSWRMWGTEYMRKILLKNGIKDAYDRVIDRTGNEHGIRGYQIQCWLDRNPEVTKFAILDDESDMGPLLDHLVKTNKFIGLTMADAERVLQLLS